MDQLQQQQPCIPLARRLQTSTEVMVWLITCSNWPQAWTPAVAFVPSACTLLLFSIFCLPLVSLSSSSSMTSEEWEKNNSICYSGHLFWFHSRRHQIKTVKWINWRPERNQRKCFTVVMRQSETSQCVSLCLSVSFSVTVCVCVSLCVCEWEKGTNEAFAVWTFPFFLFIGRAFNFHLH